MVVRGGTGYMSRAGGCPSGKEIILGRQAVLLGVGILRETTLSAPIQPPHLQVQEALIGDTHLHGAPRQGGGGSGSASGSCSRADVRLAAGKQGGPGEGRDPRGADRVGSSSEAGDPTRTPFSGCKMRSWAPSSPRCGVPAPHTGQGLSL